MITSILTLTRPLVVLDTETTGLDVQTCRIVEIAFQVWYHDERPVKEWRSLVNPLVPIGEEVSKIHGIRDEHVRSCQRCQSLASCACPDGFKPWPTFKQLAASLSRGFVDCDFCGQNVRFDLRILDSEFRRAGVPWTYAGARVLDSKVLEQLAEPRSLSHLYKKYTGQEHDGAHGALADVRAAATVIAAQLERHVHLPKDVAALHELQWPGWIDAEGKFVFIDGEPCFGRWGKFAGKPMRDPEVNRPGRNGQTYWDFILTSEFSVEIKRLASDAKLGRFPEPKESA